jgi:hypothetical protein
MVKKSYQLMGILQIGISGVDPGGRRTRQWPHASVSPTVLMHKGHPFQEVST